tara:strand:- start:154 stop:333 length:180 start_codon:yes stop_codon:yes gene_type:complete
MNLNFNELGFVKQAIDSITIKGSDALFVAGVYTKLEKALQKEAKKLQQAKELNITPQAK